MLIIGAGTGTDVALALTQGAQARRRRRDRPADLRDRQGAEPRSPVRRPEGRRADQRRPRVPRAHEHLVRPDHLRVARLDDARGRGNSRCASRATSSRRKRSRPRVTTSSPAAPSRCTTTTARTGSSAASRNTAAAAFGHDPCIDLLSTVRAVIVSGLTPADQTCGTGEGAVARGSERPGPRHRQPSLPVPEGCGDPVDLPVGRSG